MHVPRTCHAHTCRATHIPRTSHAHTLHMRIHQVSRVYILGLPANADTYLHLAGRTGRWPRPSLEDGEATVVTIATQAELRTLSSWSNGLGGAQFVPIE